MSSLQTSVAVANNAITGTLHKVTSGSLAQTWGEGHFIALGFTDNSGGAAKSIKVGLVPSQGSGLVELDSDMGGVFKVTDKDAQKFRVTATDASGLNRTTTDYDLSGLTLADS